MIEMENCMIIVKTQIFLARIRDYGISSGGVTCEGKIGSQVYSL
jgi:hypothetical protein